MTRRRTVLLFALATGVSLGLIATRRATGVVHGLRAEYFAPDLNITRDGAQVITAIDTDISTEQMEQRWRGPMPVTFSVEWVGNLSPLRSGTRTFALTSDDGSRLWIDGRLAIDNSGRHRAQTRTTTVDLAAGAHRVFVEYSQLGGDAALNWTWGPTADRQSRVPAWLLTPDRQPLWRIVTARTLDISITAAAVVALAAGGYLVLAFGMTARSRRHAAVLLLFAALAVVETWPLATDPAHLSRNDNGDAVLLEWVIAWVAHAAVASPSHLFDGNVFFPERNTVALSETMVVQSAMAAPILWLGGSPVLAYNLVLLAGFALSGWTMYLVIVRWTGSTLAGLVAGVLFAFNAHSLTRIPHLQAQHVEFLPLALAALDQLLRRPTLRNAVKLALWFVLQALTSIYLLVLTAMALLVSVVVRPEDLVRTKAVRVLVVAAVLAGLLLIPFVLPYWRVHQDQGLSRSLDDVARFSATWRDYVSTPSRIDYISWSHRWFSGAALFPGIVALLLAGVAVARRIAFTDERARMCLAFGIVGVLLSFGTHMPGYALLYRVLLPLQAIRAVNRFGYLGIVAVAALAGFGTAELQRSMSPRLWQVAGASILAVATLETMAAPLELTRFDGIPFIYDLLRADTNAITVDVPFYGPAAGFAQARYMLNSTRHWHPILNGYSGFLPDSYHRNVEDLAGFPDRRAIDSLRRQHVTHVFVHIPELPPAVVQAVDASADLERRASDGSIVLYRVRP